MVDNERQMVQFNTKHPKDTMSHLKQLANNLFTDVATSFVWIERAQQLLDGAKNMFQNITKFVDPNATQEENNGISNKNDSDSNENGSNENGSNGTGNSLNLLNVSSIHMVSNDISILSSINFNRNNENDNDGICLQDGTGNANGNPFDSLLKQDKTPATKGDIYCKITKCIDR